MILVEVTATWKILQIKQTIENFLALHCRSQKIRTVEPKAIIALEIEDHVKSDEQTTLLGA